MSEVKEPKRPISAQAEAKKLLQNCKSRSTAEKTSTCSQRHGHRKRKQKPIPNSNASSSQGNQTVAAAGKKSRKKKKSSKKNKVSSENTSQKTFEKEESLSLATGHNDPEEEEEEEEEDEDDGETLDDLIDMALDDDHEEEEKGVSELTSGNQASSSVKTPTKSGKPIVTHSQSLPLMPTKTSQTLSVNAPAYHQDFVVEADADTLLDLIDLALQEDVVAPEEVEKDTLHMGSTANGTLISGKRAFHQRQRDDLETKRIPSERVPNEEERQSDEEEEDNIFTLDDLLEASEKVEEKFPEEEKETPPMTTSRVALARRRFEKPSLVRNLSRGEGRRRAGSIRRIPRRPSCAALASVTLRKVGEKSTKERKAAGKLLGASSLSFTSSPLSSSKEKDPSTPLQPQEKAFPLASTTLDSSGKKTSRPSTTAVSSNQNQEKPKENKQPDPVPGKLAHLLAQRAIQGSVVKDRAAIKKAWRSSLRSNMEPMKWQAAIAGSDEAALSAAMKIQTLKEDPSSSSPTAPLAKDTPQGNVKEEKTEKEKGSVEADQKEKGIKVSQPREISSRPRLQRRSLSSDHLVVVNPRNERLYGIGSSGGGGERRRKRGGKLTLAASRSPPPAISLTHGPKSWGVSRGKPSTWKRHRSKSGMRGTRLQMGSIRSPRNVQIRTAGSVVVRRSGKPLALTSKTYENQSRLHDEHDENQVALSRSDHQSPRFPPGLSPRRALRRSVSANSVTQVQSLSPVSSPTMEGTCDPTGSERKTDKSQDQVSLPDVSLLSTRCVLFYSVLNKDGDQRMLCIDPEKQEMRIYRAHSKRIASTPLVMIPFHAVSHYQVTSRNRGSIREGGSKTKSGKAMLSTLPKVCIYGQGAFVTGRSSNSAGSGGTLKGNSSRHRKRTAGASVGHNKRGDSSAKDLFSDEKNGNESPLSNSLGSSLTKNETRKLKKGNSSKNLSGSTNSLPSLMVSTPVDAKQQISRDVLIVLYPLQQLYEFCEVLNLIGAESTRDIEFFKPYQPILCLKRTEIPVKGVGNMIVHVSERNLYLFQPRNDAIPWSIFDMRMTQFEKESDTVLSLSRLQQSGSKLKLGLGHERCMATWYKALRKASQVSKQDIQRVLDAVFVLKRLYGLPFDRNNPRHINVLRPIWSAISEENFPETNLQSEDWKFAGFQRDTPDSDLRRVGVLGVHTLRYFVLKYPCSFAELLESANDESEGYYPFAAVAINLTDVLITRLKVFDVDKSGALSVFESFPLFFGRGDVFCELFCYSLALFDKLWREMNANYMEFPKVLTVWKSRLTVLLERPPQRGGISALFDMIPALD